jgi:hypothetical protein
MGIEDLRLNALIEVDPRSNFEAFLKAQAMRCAERGDAVFVFTSEGSPLHRMLQGVEGISLVLLSVDPDAVRRDAQLPERVSLLTLDRPHFLTLLDTLMSTEGRVHVFLDSISSMAMALGFQDTYRLLRQAIEIVGRTAGSRINAFAVIIEGTLSEAERNTFRSMFQVILRYDGSGPVVLKPPNVRILWAKPARPSAKGRPSSAEKDRRSAANAVRGFLGSLTKSDRSTES